jgi:hypothetical protein
MTDEMHDASLNDRARKDRLDCFGEVDDRGLKEEREGSDCLKIAEFDPRETAAFAMPLSRTSKALNLKQFLDVASTHPICVPVSVRKCSLCTNVMNGKLVVFMID